MKLAARTRGRLGSRSSAPSERRGSRHGADSELAEPGTQLEVDVAGDRRDAVVVAVPFIDPKEIPKQRLATEH